MNIITIIFHGANLILSNPIHSINSNILHDEIYISSEKVIYIINNEEFSFEVNDNEIYFSDSILHAEKVTIKDSVKLFNLKNGPIRIVTTDLISVNAIIYPMGTFTIETSRLEGNIHIEGQFKGPLPIHLEELYYKTSASSGQNGNVGGAGNNGSNAGGKIKWGIPKSTPSSSGGNGQTGQNGQNGQNGLPGLNGNRGRDCYDVSIIVYDKVKKQSKISIFSIGEIGLNGTMGQNGGEGGNGGDGGNGGKGGAGKYDRNASSGGQGGAGGTGGNGGNGGDGGHGGRGGDGGNIYLDVQKKHPKGDYWYELKTFGGKGGSGGKGGFGGKGGKGGTPGAGGQGGDGHWFKHGGSSGLGGRPGIPGKDGNNGVDGQVGPNGRNGMTYEPVLIIEGERIGSFNPPLNNPHPTPRSNPLDLLRNF